MAKEIYMVNGQMERTKEIVKKILKNDIDIICFLEMFHHDSKKFIIENLSSLYPYHKEMPKSFLSLLNSGIFVISKYKINNSKYIHFKDSQDSDSFASKGALYLKINKKHFIFCHLQAWDKHEDVRKKQLEQIYDWIKNDLKIKTNIFIIGDFNIDYYDEKNIQKKISLPKNSYTFDPSQNSLYGLDGTAEENGCGSEYFCQLCKNGILCPLTCSSENKQNKKIYCECCPKRLTDWAFVLNPKKIKTIRGKVLKWKSKKNLHFTIWKFGWISRPMIKTKDLSDHFPLLIETK